MLCDSDMILHKSQHGIVELSQWSYSTLGYLDGWLSSWLF